MVLGLFTLTLIYFAVNVWIVGDTHLSPPPVQSVDVRTVEGLSCDGVVHPVKPLS